MVKKHKKSLGRGLDALLKGAREQTKTEKGKEKLKSSYIEASSKHAHRTGRTDRSEHDDLEMSDTKIVEISLSYLQPGKYQPRQEFSETELENLAESIRNQGVLQPIVIRQMDKEKYEIIAGERRFRAAKILNLQTIPAIIKEMDDKEALAVALIENIQRENLGPLEEAMAVERLTKEFALTHVQAAEALGKSRAHITNLLRVLTLNEEVKMLLSKGEIEMGHAKVLLGLRGHEQTKMAWRIKEKSLSVRELENLIQQKTSADDFGQDRNAVKIDPDVRRLQMSLSEKLGAKVEIVQGSQGKGKLVIQYNSLDELDGILEHIK